MFRFISLTLRKIQSGRKEKKILNLFNSWKQQIVNLPASFPSLKKLLIIRLDDIGDYLLFRNFLGVYKASPKWKNYKITLLGNSIWKDLFEAHDINNVDDTIWVDKRQYLTNEIYRTTIWSQLRSQNFETVICPSRTRPLLLDDFCVLATDAGNKVGSVNTFIYQEWNEVSDALYSQLFLPDDILEHEFLFNKSFAEWCCNVTLNANFPYLENLNKESSTDACFICFIGASAKSKRWPVKRWSELIRLIKDNYRNKIFIAGGKADIDRANAISSLSGVESNAGKTSLNETISLIANAKAVITNDTMAAHAAAACSTPAIIIASGNNYYRFTSYNSIGSKNLVTIYPEIFLKKLQKGSDDLLYYEAISADIATISAKKVFESLKKLLL
jgi:ADP-heptose:LPS heptosyltransferase